MQELLLRHPQPAHRKLETLLAAGTGPRQPSPVGPESFLCALFKAPLLVVSTQRDGGCIRELAPSRLPRQLGLFGLCPYLGPGSAPYCPGTVPPQHCKPSSCSLGLSFHTWKMGALAMQQPSLVPGPFQKELGLCEPVSAFLLVTTDLSLVSSTTHQDALGAVVV